MATEQFVEFSVGFVKADFKAAFSVVPLTMIVPFWSLRSL
jgi:hypothetical protein